SNPRVGFLNNEKLAATRSLRSAPLRRLRVAATRRRGSENPHVVGNHSLPRLPASRPRARNPFWPAGALSFLQILLRGAGAKCRRSTGRTFLAPRFTAGKCSAGRAAREAAGIAGCARHAATARRLLRR